MNTLHLSERHAMKVDYKIPPDIMRINGKSIIELIPFHLSKGISCCQAYQIFLIKREHEILLKTRATTRD